MASVQVEVKLVGEDIRDRGLDKVGPFHLDLKVVRPRYGGGRRREDLGGRGSWRRLGLMRL